MSTPSSPHATATAPSGALLQPGHNCWRIETATKLQFLIDGEEYFRALRTALQRAQHAIYIVGWDIDSRVTLPRSDSDDTLPEALAQFLDALARRRRDLEIYVLSWDYAVLFTLEREWLPALQLQWRTHRRVHFCLDDQHPVGASHHQKFVVVDDRVAFIGGIDITRCRWDTSAHAPMQPLRQDASGKSYAPFHDIQAIVEGPVAGALGELARGRWWRATGRKHRPQNPRAGSASPWPPELAPALENIQLGIARTEAPFEHYPGHFEIRNFYRDAIAAARDVIFFENQYFSSNIVAQALSQSLQEPTGPAVIVLTPHRESGWLEENTMGLLRARLYEKLKSGNHAPRFHAYCPVLADASGLNVHSKLMTIDDEWLTLGSANISNRSMSLDTECNLILAASIQGGRAVATRHTIAHLRNRLLAEHLDCAVESIAVTQQRMSLIETIETLRTTTQLGERRTLIPAEPMAISKNILLTDAMLIDPETPLEPERVIANYIAVHERKPVRGHATHIGIAVVIFGALVLLWRETPLREFLNIHAVFHFVEKLQQQPLAPLWILTMYVVAGLVFIPVVLLIAATGIVFGPWLGFLYATCGSLLSAAVTFWIGSKTGAQLWRRLFGGRLTHLQTRLRRQGLLAVAMVRAVPVAPFTAVNLIAGAAKIRWRDFMLGTLTGMLPGIIMTVLFVDRAAAALRRPTLGSIAALVLTMGIIVAVSIFLQHWLRRKDIAKASTSALDD